MNWNKTISILSAFFVLCLTVVSIILTYNALYEVAYDNGLTGKIGGLNLAYIWPLTIDGALLVFSLAVINASLAKDSTMARWVMVGLFTGLTIAFNFVDGGTDRLPDFVGSSLPFIVRTVPPVALVLSFETLMSMLRKSVNRNDIVKSLATLEAEWDNERAKIEAERGQLIRQLEQSEGQLKGQLEKLKGQIESANKTIEQIKLEQKQLDQGTIFQWLPDNLPVEVRQQIVYNMSNAGVTIGQQAGYLRVSEGTIKNDRRVVFSDNGNGYNGG